MAVIEFVSGGSLRVDESVVEILRLWKVSIEASDANVGLNVIFNVHVDGRSVVVYARNVETIAETA